MKDYERLTEKNSSFCTDCVAIGFCKETCIKQNIYERLQFLENKIESGEIDYIADKDKQIDGLKKGIKRLCELIKEYRYIISTDDSYLRYVRNCQMAKVFKELNKNKTNYCPKDEEKNKNDR